jgi:hypothetical protein
MQGFTLHEPKFEELVLYVNKQYSGGPRLGSGLLNKILCLADCLAYRRFGQSITGLEYQKTAAGPVPCRPIDLRKVVDIDAIRSDTRHDQKEMQDIVPRHPDSSLFRAGELTLVDEVIRKMQNNEADSDRALKDIVASWRNLSEWDLIKFG